MLHNQILSNKKTKKKLPWILISFGLFALFCIVSVFVYYKYIFFDFKIDSNVEHFGQFGDFIGGTLNPILAFLSFMALLYTIKIQMDELKLSREELEATREELKESRIAQQEQSESLKLQNKATTIQMFENTFFQLINLFIGIRNEFELEIEIKEDSSFSGKYKYKIIDLNETFTVSKPLEKLLFQGYKVIEVFFKMLIKHKFEYDKFNDIYERYTGTYFGQIYQILKFIDDSYKEKKIENSQRYVNIFRAQFTKDELKFLFYHCLGSIGKRRFKKLVEDYEFFEHIILNEDIEKQLLEYDKKAFGKNEKILEKYNELKESKE
ncbi:putative phage abortive infection protein [Aliarcobacter butzleri]|uniref:putative phage abortive infection protein n=1 Tax=Aliarcobacter butzleri TaxID=28197 RepID=UPI001ED9EC13|nr:putative phage abortive infection protein [Aliarcobacter butzleri]MCG3657247.1 putative phage abortive infection protein [Aliarcobacter butzleri]MDK2051943.1 putative phage abortive infection protein [Aliarcobacter butzleri]